jgi:hypothetical protein
MTGDVRQMDCLYSKNKYKLALNSRDESILQKLLQLLKTILTETLL